jgi:hypothetical protein
LEWLEDVKYNDLIFLFFKCSGNKFDGMVVK